MVRKIIYAILILLVGILVLAWLNRDALVDRAIQGRLQQTLDHSFIEDGEHVRALVCGTGSPEVS